MDQYLEKAKKIMDEGKILILRECSFCGTQLYFFRNAGVTFYNSNCSCVNFKMPSLPRSDEKLKFYTDQESIRKKWEL